MPVCCEGGWACRHLEPRALCPLGQGGFIFKEPGMKGTWGAPRPSSVQTQTWPWEVSRRSGLTLCPGSCPGPAVLGGIAHRQSRPASGESSPQPWGDKTDGLMSVGDHLIFTVWPNTPAASTENTLHPQDGCACAGHSPPNPSHPSSTTGLVPV